MKKRYSKYLLLKDYGKVRVYVVYKRDYSNSIEDMKTHLLNYGHEIVREWAGGFEIRLLGVYEDKIIERYEEE